MRAHHTAYDCACNHLTHASTLHLLLLLLQLHYYYSIGAAKRDAEVLLKTLLSDTTTGLNSTTEAMSTDEVSTALDGINITVTGLFTERVQSITKAYKGAETIADSAVAELFTLLDTRFDTVRTRHALLREKLDSTVAAAQDDSVVEFLIGVDAIQLPLPSSGLDAKLKALLDATTEKLSRTALALVNSVTLQQELPSFASATSAQAFARLEAVTRAIVQHRAANGTHAELKVQQEATAAADVAATQAKAAAAKAVADAARAEEAAAEQLADYKRRAAQRQREQDADLQAERAQTAAAESRLLQQQRQQQQWLQQQREQEREPEPSPYSSCGGGSPARQPQRQQQQRSRSGHVPFSEEHYALCAASAVGRDGRSRESRALRFFDGVQYNIDGSVSGQQPRR
jgi:hypothetical protein